MSTAAPPTPAPTTSTPPEPVARPSHRATAVDRLLDGLEALVARHRALVPRSVEDQRLHAELIDAETAHEIAIARARLRRSGEPVETPAVSR